ncbi:helix-turn-helix domain-containing protein [Nocardiopsis alba]|uniref:helix-turn-helix domain-containing protein n=1 Tax=Nocardiopsis alba TaxID=53437 RepID=UPI00366EC059
MSTREFAAYLGISSRTVSKWEAAGKTALLRPHSQSLLDTALARASSDTQRIFWQSFDKSPGFPPVSREGQFTVTSHKFIPVYIGPKQAESLSTEVPNRSSLDGLWLDHTRLEVPYLEANTRCTLYVLACGVALFHLEQERTPDNLTALALWRYRSYAKDLPWAEATIKELLGHPEQDPPTAEYVLSLYYLHDGPWGGKQLDSALRLLSTPSVLVDRHTPNDPHPLDPTVETEMLDQGFDHQGIVEFGIPEIAIGHAAWSGVAYHVQAPERALPLNDLLACEVAVQALWCFCRHVEVLMEQGHDPVMPEPYGWRFLRSAHSRLTTARARETAQHRFMREAIVATSGITERLRIAQDALKDSTYKGITGDE